ncbi:hypothetical protein AAMO2058_001481700 [Amorphochlora amoebiformis]
MGKENEGRKKQARWKRVEALHSGRTLVYGGQIYVLSSAKDLLQPSSFQVRALSEQEETDAWQGSTPTTTTSHRVLLQSEQTETESPGSPQFWIYVAICAGCVLLGGVMSGLTVGYFSIDELKLLLLTEADASGAERANERLYAQQVKPCLNTTTCFW